MNNVPHREDIRCMRDAETLIRKIAAIDTVASSAIAPLEISTLNHEVLDKKRWPHETICLPKNHLGHSFLSPLSRDGMWILCSRIPSLQLQG